MSGYDMTRYWLFIASPLSAIVLLLGLVALFSPGPIQRISGPAFRGTFTELPVLSPKNKKTT